MLKHDLFVLAPFILAAVASAQVTGPAVFSPAAPTERDQIRATFTLTGFCGINTSTVVTGTVVRTTVSIFGCLIGPPPLSFPQDVSFGPLPPSAYTYELYSSYEGGPPQFVSQQRLVVSAAPPIPALSASSLILLTVVLAAVALLALGRLSAQ